MSEAVLQQPLSRPTQTCLLSRLRLLGLGRKQIKRGVAQRIHGRFHCRGLSTVLGVLVAEKLVEIGPALATFTIATDIIATLPYPYLSLALQTHNPGTWVIPFV
jgi:hypothetical protein